MLEKVIKRRFYLQKHLEAPLLQEREDYVKILAEKGLCHTSLLVTADYLLRIVQLLNLKDGESIHVSLSSIDEAADKWANMILNHPMKRTRKEGSKNKFITIAVKWLGKIDRLDTLYQDTNVLINKLFSRGFAKRRYLTSPLLNERLSYLEYWESKGAVPTTLRKIANYQLHLIEYLSLDTPRLIEEQEIFDAAEAWTITEIASLHKKSGSKGSKASFLNLAKGWLTYLKLLNVEERSFLHQDYVNAYLMWLKKDKGYSENTIATRLSMLKTFMTYLGSINYRIEILTPAVIDNYLCKRHDIDGCNRLTVAGIVTVLRDFLGYAESQNWCKLGLALSIKAPRIYHQESLPSYPSWSIIQNIIKKKSSDRLSEIRDCAMLLLLSVYGMRCSEVLELKLKDIDWRKEQIYLHRAKNCKPQILPLLPFVGEAIIRYIKEVRQNESHCETLFICMRAPYRPLTNAALYRIVSASLKDEHVELKHYGPHSLRHGCATHLVNAGYSMKEIADLLGHQQLDTTRIYAKVDLANLRKVADMEWGDIL